VTDPTGEVARRRPRPFPWPRPQSSSPTTYGSLCT